MSFLLDTNTCIGYLRRPTGLLAKKILATPSAVITLSTITVTELFRGAHLSAKVADNLEQISIFIRQFAILPLDLSSAEIAGRIDADLAKQGLRIGPYDTLIAAIALAHNCILVTHNISEFSRIIGLRIEDWEATA
jgi:tRNA(fMet)-specific endonuclease VapC